MVNFEIEKEYISDGFSCICGVDEAGRGPLAGPVCAAAVILPVGVVIPGLDDSKKLTEKKREALYDVIKETAVSYGIAFASENEIDESKLKKAISDTGYSVTSFKAEPYEKKKGLFSFLSK